MLSVFAQEGRLVTLPRFESALGWQWVRSRWESIALVALWQSPGSARHRKLNRNSHRADDDGGDGDGDDHLHDDEEGHAAGGAPISTSHLNISFFGGQAG